MSDYGDEMDVDAGAHTEDHAVTFSSKHESHGKRSAANLPIEAEDTLPWYVPNSTFALTVTNLKPQG
ncbi:hypothetical protein V491_06510 [Pseudogymnoascus sp. VKM F-3775]|nr:hypothetical protein V491_06510 [Pseudogymnoascus sp. VKM F-3775]